MVPDKFRQEWKDLITKDSIPQIASFSLKMKINSLRVSYKSGLISLSKAVDDLYALCQQYERIYQKDLDIIFQPVK